MPLIGIVDPSHDERAADEPGRLPVWIPRDELVARAATEGPMWSPWSYELLTAALEEWQDRDYLSTTMLTGGCSRSNIIERRADFVLTVDSLYASLMGTLIHRTLEYNARPGASVENRFFTELEYQAGRKVTLSCSPDIVTATALGDYKKTENPPAYQYPWRSHTAQVNVNRYIVNHARDWEGELAFNPRTAHIQELYLVYLGPKGPKTLVCTKKQPVTFKNGKEGTRSLPYVWTDDECEEYIFPRLAALELALDAYPEWPDSFTDETPGFEGPPGWACPGKPWCSLPDCLAKRYPNGLTW